MKTCNTDYEDLVRGVVTDKLATRFFDLAPLPTYPDTIVYEATSDERSVVFKAVDPGGRDPDGIGLEAWALQRAASVGVPVPTLLTVDMSRERFPASYMLMAKVDGRPANSITLNGEARIDLFRRVGAALAVLHNEHPPGFGWLDEAQFRRNGEVRGSHDSWPVALYHDVPAAVEYLSAEALSPADSDVLRAAARELEHVTGEPRVSSLLHGDLGTTHVWVNPQDLAITGIIDFGERAAGDWVWDLLEFEPRDVPAVLEGYAAGPAFREEATRLFWTYAVLKAIPWASKWHQRGETQVTSWLITALRNLGSP